MNGPLLHRTRSIFLDGGCNIQFPLNIHFPNSTNACVKIFGLTPVSTNLAKSAEQYFSVLTRGNSLLGPEEERRY